VGGVKEEEGGGVVGSKEGEGMWIRGVIFMGKGITKWNL